MNNDTEQFIDFVVETIEEQGFTVEEVLETMYKLEEEDNAIV